MTERRLSVKAPDQFASAAEWANAYRSLGLAVIPAGADKRPYARWKEFQSGIPQAVHERWYGLGGEYRANPRMGFLTGAASIGDGWNLLLIDLDVKGSISGRDTWEAWIGEHELGCFPETWTARSGGGGTHIYFKYPASLTIRNTQETIRGVDVRAEGGFIVAPPTLHQSGKPYKWEISPWDAELAEAPQWLLDIVGASMTQRDRLAPKSKSAAPEHATDAWGHIVDGRDAYMRNVVWAAVVDWHRECPIPPSENEIEARLLEAYKAYETRVRPQGFGSLEDEGRGLTAFRSKWAYAMRQWSEKVAAAAAVPSTHAAAPDFHWEAPKPTGERFRFESIGDLRLLPPVKWLVDRWIPEGATGLFYGKWGAGKSFVGFDLALHVAYGMESWHGAALPAGGVDVLIIAREGHQGFVQRIDAFKQMHGIVDDTPRLHFMRGSVSFMLPDDFKALCAAIEGQQTAYRLVIIDTVARVLPGVDMNAQETVTAFMERCSAIAAITSAATIGVHHQNKSGGMMGSVYFEANADFVFEVERLGGDDDPLRLGEITCTKMKDGEDRWKRTVHYEKISLNMSESSLAIRLIDTSSPEKKSSLPERETCRRILSAIDEAWNEGRPLSHMPQAKSSGKYAQRVLAKAFSVPAKTIEELIVNWLDNDILSFEIVDKKTKAKGLRVTGNI